MLLEKLVTNDGRYAKYHSNVMLALFANHCMMDVPELQPDQASGEGIEESKCDEFKVTASTFATPAEVGMIHSGVVTSEELLVYADTHKNRASFAASVPAPIQDASSQRMVDDAIAASQDSGDLQALDAHLERIRMCEANVLEAEHRGLQSMQYESGDFDDKPGGDSALHPDPEPDDPDVFIDYSSDHADDTMPKPPPSHSGGASVGGGPVWLPPPPDDDDDVFLDGGDDENGDYSLEVAPTAIPPDAVVSGAPAESAAPEHVPTPTAPIPTPTPSVIHICDTPGCRRRPESGPCGLAKRVRTLRDKKITFVCDNRVKDWNRYPGYDITSVAEAAPEGALFIDVSSKTRLQQELIHKTDQTYYWTNRVGQLHRVTRRVLPPTITSEETKRALLMPNMINEGRKVTTTRPKRCAGSSIAQSTSVVRLSRLTATISSWSICLPRSRARNSTSHATYSLISFASSCFRRRQSSTATKISRTG